jgi:hypothetical protein
MLARDTKIYKDTFELAKYVFGVTKKIKAEYRATIARRIEDLTLQLSMKIVEANLCPPNSDERVRVLGRDFILVQEQLFFLLALSQDKKIIDEKSHANIARRLDEIGREATGWRKATMK